MKNMFVFLLLWVILLVIGILVPCGHTTGCDFMSKAHTTICRGVAAIIIIFQHAAGGFGLRYFTPLTSPRHSW